MGMWSTLPEMLEIVASSFGAKGVHFPDIGTEISYEQLVLDSDALGSGLIEYGLEPNKLVALVFPHGPEFLTSLFGVMKAGAVPTALQLPGSLSDVDRFMERLAGLVRTGGVHYALVHSRFAELTRGGIEGLQVIAYESCPRGSTGSWRQPHDLAIVQFSSGSTSAPKGIPISHANLAAGLNAISKGAQIISDDVLCSWLPHYHDMGLIGGLVALQQGAEQHVWGPASFIRKPARWLTMFSRLGGTLYTGPNFSYQYMVDHISIQERAELDLSAWRVAFNGAEPIDPRCVERFIEYFEPAGFRATSMFPVYGLAEATLAATFPPVGRPGKIEWIDTEALGNEAEARIVPRTHRSAKGVLGVGQPVWGHMLRIRDEDGRTLGDGKVGEIQLCGPAIMTGYLGSHEERAFHNGWLCTGDLGYTREGELFVTGRKKELLIVRGKNYYPQDVEPIAADVDGVYHGRCAAFTLGDEAIVVLAETILEDDSKLTELSFRIWTEVTAQVGISEVIICVVPRRSIQRTTSGKIQRVRMREDFTRGELRAKVLARYPAVQPVAGLI